MKSAFAILLALLTIGGPAWGGAVEDRALVEASFNLNLKGVQAALAKGADPNALKIEKSPSGSGISWPVLLSAVFGQPTQDTWQQANKDEWDNADQYISDTRTAIAKTLFDAGATLDKLDIISRSALFSTSIVTGNLRLIELLIDHGESVTKKIFPEDLTPSEVAESAGQHRAYQLLVSRGAPPVDAASSAQFALISSAKRADLNGMEAAVKNGAQINNLINNQTALNVALVGYIYDQPRVSAVTWLLDHGADPNVGNGTYSPLDNFVLSSSITLRELNKMTEDDLKAIKQSTGKEFNVEQARAFNEEILVRLLKAGAKVSGRSGFGWTPLHVAAANDNVMAAKILIREGAKIMPRNNDGKTPLDLAETAAKIKLLKENGATEQ